MKKYEYRYERVQVTLKFLGLTDIMERHRRIIDDYGAQGWRYAGNIPVMTTAEGRPVEFDLIFERETDY